MRRILTFLLSVLLSTVISNGAFAAPLSRAPLRESGQELVGNVLNSTNLSTTASRHFVGFIAPLGRVEISLSTFNEKNWPAYFESAAGEISDDETLIVLAQGKIKHRARVAFGKQRKNRSVISPAAAIVYSDKNGNDKKLAISFANQGRWTSRFFQVKAEISKSANGSRSFNSSPTLQKVKVGSSPAFALASKKCGKDEFVLGKFSLPLNSDESSSSTKNSATTQAASTLRILDFATDCDYECYQSLGGSAANATISGYINTINTIYQTQLGLKLHIISQVARTSTSKYPSSTTNSSDLLDLFHGYAPEFGSVADAKHLVTGKNLDGNIIGLGYSGCSVGGAAYAGTLCYCPEYNQALSQYINDSLTPIIMAHELGHNLGADHDTSSPGIMGTTLNMSSPPTSFSQFSINEINNFISNFGDLCLSLDSGSSSSQSSSSSSSSSTPGGGTPGDNPGDDTPTASISLSFKNGAFSASVTPPANYGTCKVTLKAATSRSNFSGRAKILGSKESSADTIKFRAYSLPYVKVSSGTPKAYVRADLQCSGGNVNSSIRSVVVSSAGKGKNSKAVKSVSFWISALAKKL